MRLSEKTQQNRNMLNFWWIIKILCLGYPLPLKTLKLETFQTINVYECWEDLLIYPFLHKEYYLFSQNNESSLEQ